MLEIISQERIEQVLPPAILSSEVISDNAKKVLGCLLHSYAIIQEARTNDLLVMPSERLRKISGMRKQDVINAIRELEENEMIIRKRGLRRIKGQDATASEYKFNWARIKNPPEKKKDFFDLFAKELESSGIPLGTANAIANAKSNTTSTSITSTKSNTTIISSSIVNTKSIDNTNTTPIITEEEAEAPVEVDLFSIDTILSGDYEEDSDDRAQREVLEQYQRVKEVDLPF